MENVGIFYDYVFGIFKSHFVNFMEFWYDLWSFGIFFLIWYVWIKKNLATLLACFAFTAWIEKQSDSANLCQRRVISVEALHSQKNWNLFLI
jgi:hypothetical protein